MCKMADGTSAETEAVVAPHPPQKSPLNIFYTPVHDRNINSVKLLMEVVLPVRYSAEFYKKLVLSPPEFTKMAYYDDIFVGCIGGKIEGDAAVGKKLYIMVLGVLAPYRSRGIGSELLGQVMTGVANHPEIKEIYMHVWTANEDAVKFYSRHGFSVSETLSGYYRGITPPDCYIMRKRVNEASAATPATAASV